MKWSLFRARVQARQKTWKPPKPEELLALTKNAQARFVQSEEQLLDVIIKSLRRLEDALQGETPAARDIWDRVAKNKFRAVDENAFSDYVKRHLDNDLREGGIIANREVEIRRGEGSGTGERTDIHVDAIITDEQGQVFDVVTVIIETKGCWNNELNTVHPVNGEVPPVKGRPWKLPHYVNRGKTTSSGGEMASARSCFSTVRTALGKLRITGLPAPFDVARSLPQFLRPLPLQPTVLTSKRRSRFGIRKAPNHVPPPHLPDDP